MSSGYSGTPLAAKLGIRSGGDALFVGAPDGFEAILEGLPADATTTREGDGPFDVAVVFSTEYDSLIASFKEVAPKIVKSGGLWIAWPKKASKIQTDIDENRLRDLILPGGRWVDNKVCAIDDVWSGLRFVRRKNNR